MKPSIICLTLQNSMWIKLRKKLILPFKYRRKRKKAIKQISFKEKKALYEKKEEIEGKLLKAQRLRHTKEVYQLGAQLELLKWIMYE